MVDRKTTSFKHYKPQEKQPSPYSPPPDAMAPMAYPSLMLVEDNHDDEALTLRVLTKYHFLNEAIVFTDGAQALDYLRRDGAWKGRTTPQPQMVLVSLSAPTVNGLEVVRAMRANESTRDIAAVLLVSNKEEEYQMKAVSFPKTAVICKPMGFFKLLEAMQKMEMFWFIFSSPPPSAPPSAP